MTLVECATGERRSGGGGGDGGVDRDEKIRLCLRAIRRLGAATAGAPCDAAACGTPAADKFVGGSSPEASSGPAARSSFAEAALDLTCGVVEREWVGKRGEGGRGGGGEGSGKEEVGCPMM